jgi:hypothetical protein
VILVRIHEHRGRLPESLQRVEHADRLNGAVPTF